MSKTALRRTLAAGAALAVAGAALAAATALGVAPAHAAPTPGTVKLTTTRLEFTAGAGATNDISSAGTLDPIFYLIDRNNNVQLDPSARERCVQVTAKSVRCTGITFATFNLGDKSDTFYSEGYVPVRVWGGQGNDTLEGNLSRFDETVPGTRAFLYGQAGNDHLIGGDGDDLLHAGSGTNQTADGSLGSDTCRGTNVAKKACEKL